MEHATFFVDTLLQWFSINHRDFPWRNDADPYRILIAEKMLQQTDYGHVLKIYDKFLEKYVNFEALANADLEEIQLIIRPLGLHQQRSKQLKKMANEIIDNFHGIVPNEKNKLLNLTGIGTYIANAILCFAYNVDTPIIDVNVRRVALRYFNWNLRDEELETKIMDLLPKTKCKEFNWGLIDFSSLICSSKPKCVKCIMSKKCYYNLS